MFMPFNLVGRDAKTFWERQGRGRGAGILFCSCCAKTLSMARYNRIVLDITRILKEKGCSAIVITDGYDSPLAQYADVLLLTQCESVDFHNSMVASSYLCEIIIGICTVKNPQLVKKNLKDLEKYLNKLSLMIQK